MFVGGLHRQVLKSCRISNGGKIIKWTTFYMRNSMIFTRAWSTTRTESTRKAKSVRRSCLSPLPAFLFLLKPTFLWELSNWLFLPSPRSDDVLANASGHKESSGALPRWQRQRRSLLTLPKWVHLWSCKKSACQVQWESQLLRNHHWLQGTQAEAGHGEVDWM